MRDAAKLTLTKNVSRQADILRSGRSRKKRYIDHTQRSVAVHGFVPRSNSEYHRQAERGFVSRYFTDLASRLLTASLASSLLAIVLEVFLVCKIILKTTQ